MSSQTVSLDRYETSPKEALGPNARQPGRRGSGKDPSYGTNTLFSTADLGLSYRESADETSITIQLWHPTQSHASTSTISKAPILREVPQFKHKLTRRERGDAGGAVSETRSFQSLKSAAPSFLKERPSRGKLGNALQSPQQQTTPQYRGAWKRAIAIFRENGTLLIQDRALIHSIKVKELSTYDIRLVDDSLFSSPNILGIFSASSTYASTVGGHAAAGTANLQSPTVPAAGLASRDSPIYLLFSTSKKLKRWRDLLRTYARPELYGAADQGGTHRYYRQLDVKIHEAKLVAESRTAYAPLLTSDVLEVDNDHHIGDKNNSTLNTNAIGIVPSPDGSISSKMSDLAAKPSSASVSNLSIDSELTRASTEDTDARGREGEDDESNDSDGGAANGPITGGSTQEKVAEVGAGQSSAMDRKGSDNQMSKAATCSWYCALWYEDEIAAQTKIRTGSPESISWFDKVSLRDLPALSTVIVDVLKSSRGGKFQVFGNVHLPIDTMRRGENVEGWYPIWSKANREADGQLPTCFTARMVGELKLSLTVQEIAILPLRRYRRIEEALHSSHCISLMQSLCKELEEDQVVSHLVNIYTSSGTIVERLTALTEMESSRFEARALLFRGNTLLTRAVDMYQRLCCKDWLAASVGPTIRKICHEQIWLKPGDAFTPHPCDDWHDPPTAASEAQHCAEADLAVLRDLCRDMWHHIYDNRHKCPADLRRVLNVIRNTVNARFKQSTDGLPPPGIQGVGAFVFLRLICPAITKPNLYGLIGSSPNEACSRTLMLVAKVILALANKKMEFDKDKEPWLVQASDFLVDQATAYDDYITYVSTKPPSPDTIQEPIGDENDSLFQKTVKKRLQTLPLLCQESLPSPAYHLDPAMAYSSFVSYVVRGVRADMDEEGDEDFSYGTEGANTAEGEEERLQRLDTFIDLCCDVEDQVGRSIDRAGYQPAPINFDRSKMITIRSTSRTHQPAAAQRPSAYPLSTQPGITSYDKRTNPSGATSPNRMRRSTVSEGKIATLGTRAASQQSMVSRPARTFSVNDETFLHKVAYRLAPHLHPSYHRRSSLEADEDGQQHQQHSRLQQSSEGNTSAHQEERDRLASSSSDHADQFPTLHVKKKAGWWKRG